jgi:thiosulfate/3-mercaptopyruvate sulfurtransferase
MKALRYTVAFVFVLLIPFTGIQAQDIISANDLMKIMRNPKTVIVSTRTADDYAQVHITGAVHIKYQDLNDDMAMLISPTEIAKILGEQGISESKTIVLYDDGSEKYSGRMYWVLKYLGAPDVKILDGGMPAWRAARKPVTRTATAVKKATFTPSIKADYLATMTDVKKAQAGGGVIIDARSAAEYAGTAETKLRPGHVPSAINIEYTQVLDDGKLKSNEELQALFTKNGVTKDKTVIVYCETSVRAGILFHVLTSALDYPNVKLYDGAYREWQNTPSNKVL